MVKSIIHLFVKKGSDNQALSSGTWTKVTFDTELFDTNGNFASSRFTPTVAGQYYFCADLHHYNSASGATTIRNTALYKNGSVHTHTLRTENSVVGNNKSRSFCNYRDEWYN